VPSQNNAIYKTLDSLYQIISVCSCGVAPVEVSPSILFLLGRSNIDATELGVHNWRARLVLGALVYTGNGRQEDASTTGLGANDAF
jgi:hypothetical protein